MRKRGRKKAIMILSFLLALPIVFRVLLYIEPVVSVYAQKAAFVSAGVNFIDGSVELIKKEIEKEEPVINFLDGGGNIEDLEVEKQPEIPPENSGPIKRITYKATESTAYVDIGDNAYIKNSTKLTPEQIQKAAASKYEFKIQKKSKEPQVLVMHTHTTESYEDTERDFYDKSYNSRTTDNNKNMVSVGNKIAQELEKAGIAVIHDTTLHDYPSYSGSYDRSRVTVQNILKKYPSIKVVLDVHRDAIEQSDGTRVAPVTTINGKSCAQVMIINGCDDGDMNYPDYLKNLSFSSALLRQMEKDYPSLARPMLFTYKLYNQNLTTGSILLEMGGHANSLEEAQYAGELVGKSLAKLLV